MAVIQASESGACVRIRNKWLKSSVFLAQVLVAFLCISCVAKDMHLVNSLKFDYGVQSFAWHPDGDFIAVGYFLRDEVAIWDIKRKAKVFSIRSQRRPINYSRQEMIFSRDGRYLIAQDKLDSREGNPPFPVKIDSEEEMRARADDQRYVLARIWDWREQREVAQIKGAGSQLYGDNPEGMCWVGGKQNQLAVLREFVVTVYEVPSGKKLYEQNLANPFSENKDVSRRLKSMACHPHKSEIAFQLANFSGYAEKFGQAGNLGATPIVIADIAQKRVKNILISPRPMNGVAYSSDGKILVSSNRAPLLSWNADQDYSASAQIDEPFQSNGYLTSIPGTKSFLGLGGDQLRIWDFGSSPSVVAINDEKLEAFQIAANERKKLMAVAVGAEIRFYSYAQYLDKNH
jgi:hypothetical protein